MGPSDSASSAPDVPCRLNLVADLGKGPVCWLVDLQQDPLKLCNLCTDAAFGSKTESNVQGFVDQIEQRYQPAQIKQQVLASQRRRLIQAMHTPWDCRARKDGSKQDVRSVPTTSTTATKGKARFHAALVRDLSHARLRARRLSPPFE